MSDLERLEQALGGMTAKAHAGVVAATKVSAERAEAQARQNASGRRHLKRYPKTITADVEVGVTEIRASVGPEKGGQGSLGHLIEYGSPTSAPHLDVHQAVDGELDAWLDSLGALAGKLL